MANEGYRVLQVDSDAQGSLTTGLGIKDLDSLSETLASVMQAKLTGTPFPNTITSYCDTFRLLLTFLRDEKAMNIERLRIRDFSPGLIREYLSWLEHDRGCGISTRNQRLAALRSFFKYVSVEVPENMLLCQKIVNIPYAKKEQAAVCYLTTEEMTKLLRQPDQSSSHLLEAGINIFYIKDLLGHEDISTTEVYAKASIETQRRALEKHSLVMPPATPSWVTNTDTLEWLKTLGK